MEKSEAYKVVVDLLRLRGWAVRTLSRSESDPREIQEVTEDSWRRFFTLERCACALLDRLIAAGSLESLSAAGRTAISKAAASETQSALTARAQGRSIARIASNAGFPVVVLKGGVNAIASRVPAFPLVDIDLLVEKENVDKLVAKLERAGFGTPSRKLGHHQALSPSANHLAVEVHWTTHDDGSPLDPEIWKRLRQIEQAPPLERLGAKDNLLHLIEHAIVVHHERSVSLRDTIMIGDAARECSDNELNTVRDELARTDQHEAMTALLDFAIALHDGRVTEDPFRHGCATFYSAVVLSPLMPKVFSSDSAMAFVLQVEHGRISRMRAVRNSLQWRGTRNKELESLADRVPFIGYGILGPAHLAYYAMVAAYALPSIRSTRARALSALGR